MCEMTVGELVNEIEKLKRENESLRKYAFTDELTGVSNVRAYKKASDREWRRAIRGKNPISLIYVDLDGMKQINDELGHKAGDAAIKAIACILKRSAKRTSDLAVRKGGDEFIVLLPETDKPGSEVIAKKIISGIRLKGYRASVGVATVKPSRGDDFKDLEERADKALYVAKTKGRDRYAVYND